ncbi:MAG: coproporphyrinogen III oxidase, partial [Deltaproteobacteria bacterium]|nr:coproporphyrinogen III oxidase [Deltaproteobacteria bacterium]
MHVPFCRTRCRYCAFYSGEPPDLRGAYLRGVEAEVRAWGAGGGALDTVYVGGGTPSTLGAAGLGRIVDALA